MVLLRYFLFCLARLLVYTNLESGIDQLLLERKGLNFENQFGLIE